RRAAKFYPQKSAAAEFPFTGRIVCEKCGHHYRRKHTAIGTRYEKIVWICSTFNTSGKSVCAAQQIPEPILQAKTAEVLGLSAFDESVFAAQISDIRVPAHNTLVFVFRDGRRVEADWQNPSRRESWTKEMKQAARERQLKILEERRRLCEQ
ncbi:MAG TPA: recombinase family protein, partial [Ruminococcaceae bacterium]|nr:recombinase family protein [Oscillospiraceae bacterium]